MGLFSFLFDDNDKNDLGGLFSLFTDVEKDKKREELEKEMDLCGLEEWQKDLVRNGEYDSFSFEEEELEDDDFYEE